jgi:hypothetical protein
VRAETAQRHLVGERGELQGEGEIGVDAATLAEWCAASGRACGMLVGMRSLSLRRPAAGLVAVVLGVALVATACDDADSDPSSASSSSSRPDRTTTTTTAPGSSSTTTPVVTAPPGTPAPVNSCGVQAEFIVEAAEGSEEPALAAARDQYTAANCRLSQSEQIWAVVDLVPTAGSTFVATIALMERIGATWIVRQLGSLESCDAPERARAELNLTCS